MQSGQRQPAIERLAGIHFYTRDLARAARCYEQQLGFSRVAESYSAFELSEERRSIAFRAGACTVICSQPVGNGGGRTLEYLRCHPDGVGEILLEVVNIEDFFLELEGRGGNPIEDILCDEDRNGTVKTFAIPTPFADVTLRFVENDGYRGLLPGLSPCATERVAGLSFSAIDHVTFNCDVLRPVLLWLEQVLDFEPYWGVGFHTADVEPLRQGGSGLTSRVLWHRRTGIKFASNEPRRPRFYDSQISSYCRANRGGGVQHIALATSDIIGVVAAMASRGVEFLATPRTYYDLLPQRLEERAIGRLDEDLETLRRLGILVDGEGKDSYILQIFSKDFAALHRDPTAGPFFFELIQRKRHEGFGAGNFRALFDSIALAGAAKR
jgi:4-hydroxyphenylpyruvate dioxygenase